MQISNFIKYVILLSLWSCTVFSQPIQETRDRIVIIDSGVSLEQCKQPYMCIDGNITTFNGDNGIDEHGHGTNIISLISPKVNIKTQCITSVKIFKPIQGKKITQSNFLMGLWIAMELKAKFVNLSLSGPEYVEQEFIYISTILSNGGTVVAASGNEHKNLSLNCFAFPACYRTITANSLKKRFYVVGSTTTGGNFEGPVNVYLDGKQKGMPIMSGTSQATAIMTASLVGGVE